MSLDLRIRVDGPNRTVEPEAFFGRLPALLDERWHHVDAGLRHMGPKPLTIEVEGGSWSLTWTGDGVAVAPGVADLGAHVRLSAEQFSDLVEDQQTFTGMWTGGSLDQPRGQIGHLLNWWLVLRAVLDDRPVHVPGAIEFTAEDGTPLDLRRSFRPDDDPAEMRRFLEQAGFLHVSGLFTTAEMAEVSADMDRAAPGYADGDGRSWWATLDDGSRALVRMQGFDKESAMTAALLDDPRFRFLGALPGDGHESAAPKRADNRIEALFKPLGVVEGVSDIPWHKDCALGRHSYDCCSLTVGISVTGADDVSGQLWAMAGSHRALMWPMMLQPKIDLPLIPLPTSTGDVTVHCSCTLHMAQPPVERPRRVMYSGFPLPADDTPERIAARQRLGAIREHAPLEAAAQGIHA
jgi:hypothetical protein